MSVPEQLKAASVGLSGMKTIPVASRQLGSWHVAISRRIRTPLELAKRYDALAGSWARTAHHFRLEDAYQEPLIASGARVALAGTGVKVLDCGIGCGSLSIALDRILSNPIAYHGIDVSGKMLASAEFAMQQAGLSPKLKQADILSIPYTDQSFDLVMAAHVLEHLPDPCRAITEMVRVLKPGGLLFVCMTRRSVFGALIQLRWRTWAVTQRQGVEWLRDCHLSNIECLPVKLGAYAGQASLAFWAHKPG
ncbi:MAG: class I SAM-dependent methyltransferase [Rhodospirillaceae bacterium]